MMSEKWPRDVSDDPGLDVGVIQPLDGSEDDWLVVSNMG